MKDVTPQSMKDAFPESDGWEHKGAAIVRHRIQGGGILATLEQIANEQAANNATIDIPFLRARIEELEDQLANQKRINEMLMKRLQQVSAENRALVKPTEYTVGQEVAFCVKYSGNGETWFDGTVVYVGKGRYKIRHKDHPRSHTWREPRFMRPIEDAPKHQETTPFRVDGN